MKIYATAGITEYWVIDIQRSQVKVFRQPLKDNYQSETIVTEGTISPLAFPDIAVSVKLLLGVSEQDTD